VKLKIDKGVISDKVIRDGEANVRLEMIICDTDKNKLILNNAFFVN